MPERVKQAVPLRKRIAFKARVVERPKFFEFAAALEVN